ncbi:YybS family protein [Tuberibacillus sp. Marseille-P3662]|uniref:YybS family protein n=1 Tax=Tuberibacillus sp. Marseille-P3662 TaxID=1965358 RepID=UPI000A1CE447|nr:YybS family protein [Tuberibacillus sp. Marseille-P3662]
MRQSTILTEGAITASIFVVLLLVTGFIPVLGIIGVWFLPLPLIYFTSKRGPKPGFMVMVVAIAVSMVMSGLVLAMLALSGAALGYVIGMLIYREKTALQILVIGSLAGVFMMVFYYGLSIIIFDTNFIYDSIEMFKNSMNTVADIYSSEEMTQMVDEYKEQAEHFKNLAPLLLVGTGIIMTVIVLLVNTPVLRKLGIPFPKWPPFRDWVFPRSLVYLFMVVLLIMILFKPDEGSVLYLIIINTLLLLFYVLIIQGVAFVFYLSHAKNVGRLIPILAIVLALISQAVLYIMVLLGIIDLGFDLRKRINKNK